MEASSNKKAPKNTNITVESSDVLALPANQISVVSKETKRGCGRLYKDSLSFELHGCKPNSFYYELLVTINGLVATSALYDLRESINHIASDCTISLKTLKSTAAELTTQQIVNLFISIEDYIESKNIEDKYGKATKTVNCIRNSNGVLNNGDHIKHLNFKTRFPRRNKVPRNVISEIPDPYFSDDTELADPVSLLRFTTESELQQKMLRHFEARNKRLISLYTSAITDYLEWKELIVKLKQQPSAFTNDEIDGISHYQEKARAILKKENLEEQLKAYLHIIDKHKLYKIGKLNEFKENKLAFHGLFDDLLNDKYPLIKRYRTSPFSTGALYCDYYLPPYVLYAMQRLFQLWFAYNSDTVKQTLIEDLHIKAGERYIKISPTKHKTSDQQVREIDKKKEPFKTMVINLIVSHYKNVNKYSSRKHNSIWSGLASPGGAADLLDSAHVHKRFLKENNHPYFTVEQIRDQILCTALVKEGNPFEAMKLAGHKSLQTLNNYTNQTVIKIASEANIHEFQQQLNNSILWATKRDNKITSTKEDINKKLLFPVSDSGYENDIPEVDEWIDAVKNNKSKTITLTDERIEWCLRQHLYYTERWESINRANPERFKVVHLPRIIFTSALQKVIKEKKPRNYKQAMDSILSSGGI
ncbi:MAG: hypothetical protein OQK75_12300 [Gammaproteobacteria bacterium]|nr:hypothetical protein [Gammaproteobacteria bacterium]MCW8988438.1 hypothetical protein [Gammaproteobacteria bacterium]